MSAEGMPDMATAAKKSPAKTGSSAKKGPVTKSTVTKSPVTKSTVTKSTVTKGTATRASSATSKAAASKSATKSTPTKAPASKSTAKSAPAKKAPAKKAPAATKAAAKKTPAKQVPATKAAAKTATKTVAKATPAKKAPATKAPAGTAPAKKTTSVKAPAKKLSARALKVREDESPWTAKELRAVRSELEEELERLHLEITESEHDLAEMLADASDNAGDDQADTGSKTFEREHEMSLANNARDMLLQVERVRRLRELREPDRQGAAPGVPACNPVCDMQAARGTPLSQPPGSASPPAGRYRVRLVLALAAALVLIDQVTKAIAISALTNREPIDLLGGVITLRLVRNAGAAFGLAAGFTIVLTGLAIVVSVVIVRFARRLTSVPWAVALGLLLGGAIGNLIDRIFRAPAPFEGHVIDFLDSPVTLVFNVADMAITCAGAFMVLLTLRGVPVDDTTASEPPVEPRDDSGG